MLWLCFCFYLLLFCFIVFEAYLQLLNPVLPLQPVKSLGFPVLTLITTRSFAHGFLLILDASAPARNNLDGRVSQCGWTSSFASTSPCELFVYSFYSCSRRPWYWWKLPEYFDVRNLEWDISFKHTSFSYFVKIKIIG